jgi:galactokinase
MTPIQRAQAAFQRHFQAAPTLQVQAPGRVNLIGEHTDYNDGFVLPCAIGFGTVVLARPRTDGQVRAVACDLGEAGDAFALGAPIPRAAAGWANYVRGVYDVWQSLGLALQGADLAIAGDVPQGAGLSSSASLEVALGWLIREQHGLMQLTATDIALAAQQAENQFVGCQCGNMDQLSSACGVARHALLIDCRSLAVQPVPLPADVAVMIVHSRVRRGLVDSAYNERRLQCQAATAHLGVPALRDATLAQLQAARATMDPLVWRRAHHIITENTRTLAAAQALRAGDLAQLGALMAASHASMRDDFEITHPSVDHLVSLLQQAIADHAGSQGGARMTGGGFGGCVVAVLPRAHVPAVEASVAQGYRSPQGEAGWVFVTQAAAGAGRLA